MSKKILHVCYLDKFIPAFVRLVRDELTVNKHHFITFGSNVDKYPIEAGGDLEYLQGKLLRNFKIGYEMNQADEIVLHGLFDLGTILLLVAQPWLLKKCSWVMWGGDIYPDTPDENSPLLSVMHHTSEFCKRIIAPRIGRLVTCVKGDLVHVREKYKAKGQYVYCIVYESNCFDNSLQLAKKESSLPLSIQLGNSADPENNHEKILHRLKHGVPSTYKLFVPLSYGDKNHAKHISDVGKKIHGDSFVPMLEFMSLKEYREWQSSIDIAIFAHNRQQAMGNIITLLGLGVTVYMNLNISSAKYFLSLGLVLGDINDKEIVRLPELSLKNNREIINRAFSKETLVSQLVSWMEH